MRRLTEAAKTDITESIRMLLVEGNMPRDQVQHFTKILAQNEIGILVCVAPGRLTFTWKRKD